jgi:hypothetical protein
LQELALEEAETIALSILKQVMEEKVGACQTTPYSSSVGTIHQICDLISNR